MLPRDAATAVGRNAARSIVVAFNGKGDIAVKITDDILEHFDARDLGRLICERLGGKGGGVRDLFQGRLGRVSELEEVIKELLGALGTR